LDEWLCFLSFPHAGPSPPYDSKFRRSRIVVTFGRIPGSAQRSPTWGSRRFCITVPEGRDPSLRMRMPDPWAAGGSNAKWEKSRAAAKGGEVSGYNYGRKHGGSRAGPPPWVIEWKDIVVCRLSGSMPANRQCKAKTTEPHVFSDYQYNLAESTPYADPGKALGFCVGAATSISLAGKGLSVKTVSRKVRWKGPRGATVSKPRKPEREKGRRHRDLPEIPFCIQRGRQQSIPANQPKLQKWIVGT